jgi:hypothetical protein
LFLTANEAVIVLKKAAQQTIEKQKVRATEGPVVRMELAGGNAAPRAIGVAELSGKRHRAMYRDSPLVISLSPYCVVRRSGGWEARITMWWIQSQSIWTAVW